MFVEGGEIASGIGVARKRRSALIEQTGYRIDS